MMHGPINIRLLKVLLRWPRSAPLRNMDGQETKIKGGGSFAEVICDVRKKTPYMETTFVRPSFRDLISPTKPPRSIIKFGTGGSG